jgi:hypothetical protein
MGPMTRQVINFLKSCRGVKVGIATLETLSGCPPLKNLRNIFREFQSIASFVFPLKSKPFLFRPNIKATVEACFDGDDRNQLYL